MERCFLTWKVECVAFYLLYDSTGFTHRMSAHWVNTHSDSLSLAFLFRLMDRVGIVLFSTKEGNALLPDRSCKFTEKLIQLDFVSILCSKMASDSLLWFKHGKEKRVFGFFFFFPSEGLQNLMLLKVVPCYFKVKYKFLLRDKAEVIYWVLNYNILTTCPATWHWGFEKVWFISLCDSAKAMLTIITQAYCLIWRVLKSNLP